MEVEEESLPYNPHFSNSTIERLIQHQQEPELDESYFSGDPIEMLVETKGSLQTGDSDSSDADIEQLLNLAEVRLRNQAASQPSQALTKKTHSRFPDAPVQSKNGIARVNQDDLVEDTDRQLANNGIKKVEDPLAVKKQKFETKKATAGPSWFHMPRTDLTPELKRDLQVLRMRNVLDPKRHYKKDNLRAHVPEFSQTGTLIEGPTEFFSARVNKRDRKRTFLESVMAGEKEDRRFKRKYDELQEKKRSGKKAHYKKLMEKRYGKKTMKK